MSAVPVFCGACGKSAAPESRFCEDCGTPLKTAAAVTPDLTSAAAPVIPLPTPAPAPVPAAAPAPTTAPAPAAATARGVVLRDTNAGPGLVVVDGRQLTFTLEQHWRSPTSAPTVNTQVDVALDASGQVLAVTPVPESVLAKEKLDKMKDGMNDLKDEYLPKLMVRVDQVGKPLLIAVALLAIAWIWLPAVSINISASIVQNLTMFDLLRLANVSSSLEGMMQSGTGSSGLYGFLCVVAMIAPLAHVFVADKRAAFGLFAPLAFLVLTGLGIYLKIRNLTSAASESMRGFGGSQMGDFAGAMMKQALAAFSVGYGSYIALIVALYLAWRGVQKVLAAR